jgi:hypothetical protein
MASTLVTPTIKLLNGDLYQIEADPAKGMDDIRFRLAALYPDVFPIHQFRLVDADETNPPLTDASVLLAILSAYDGMRLESVREEVHALPPFHTGIRYTSMTRWTFIMQNNTPVYLYRYDATGKEYDDPLYQLTTEPVLIFEDFNPSKWTFLDEIDYRLTLPNQTTIRLRYQDRYLIYRAVITTNNDTERIHSSELPLSLLKSPNHCECGLPLLSCTPDHDSSTEHTDALILHASWRASVDAYLASWR